MKRMTALLALSTLAACATPPDKIKPVDLPPAAYMSKSCNELSAEKSSLDTRIKESTEVQQKAANADAAGVFLIGLPVSSMGGGDRGHELAVYKGQIIAVERARKAKGC